MRYCRLPTAIGIIFLVWLALSTGCKPAKEAEDASSAANPSDAATSGQYHEELLSIAIDNLNRLEEFDPPDVLEQMFRRLAEQGQATATQGQHPNTLLADWPETEMLRQVVNRLNQWIRTQQPPADWKIDPMVASLPKPLLNLPQVKELDRMEFSHFDGYALHEAVLARDIGRWAPGNAIDDLDRARVLFDWTVRNIQLEADSDSRIPLFAWETLLFGRGTAAERAWVFILVARQLGIEAAVLGLEQPAPQTAPKEAKKTAKAENAATAATHAPFHGPRPWCIGVLIEGKIYLFDPTIGLPIPAPGGIGRQESRQLSLQPATLAQVVADEKLLRQMDADAKHTYPVKAVDLKHVVVMLEASPTYLAKRMKLLESQLAGARRLVLSTEPTAQAEHWKMSGHMADVQLWQRPFETLDRRSHLDVNEVRSRLLAIVPFYVMPSAPLHRGRLLHLKGKLTGDNGATHYYQLARPSNEEVFASSAHQVEKGLCLAGKHDASYWLGLIAYQRGKYSSAVDWFMIRTLEAVAKSPWADGARYNLARTFESGGDTSRAIVLYSSNTAAPDYLGELLRAKWLKETMPK